MHTGSCLCGDIRYEISSDIVGVSHCHCQMCRKAHGAAFGTYGNVRREHFRFTSGEDSVVSYQSSATVTRTFCRRCGATLQWYSSVDHPEWVSITLGTLDDPFVPERQKHIHVSSKAPWYEICDEWPQKPEGLGGQL